MSRPSSPYLRTSMASPRPSSTRSRRTSGPVKAFRSASPALSAMNSVKMSQEITDKPKSKTKRPNSLPDAETLYDELQVSRKEIQTQKKIISAQTTRNNRLEADLRKREEQMESILNGHDGKESSTKNDQLRVRIIRLERELRNKDLDLSKMQFDLKTTDVNELKLALKIYSTELDRLRSINQDRITMTTQKAQNERKTQISSLKKALSALAKDREVLQLENDKFKEQLNNLRSTKLDSKIKVKNENDYLRTQLRKARISTPAPPKSVDSSAGNPKLERLQLENDHLKSKVDRMAAELEEQVTLNDKTQTKLQNGSTVSNQQYEKQVSDANTKLKNEVDKCKLLEGHVKKLESEISFLEKKAAKAEYDSVDTRSVSSNVAVSSSARSRRRETVGSTVSSNSKQADKQNDEEIIEMGRKATKRDIDSNYMRSTISWNDRLAKYAELCALEFYLTKYEEAFGWSAQKFQDFQNTMDDDVERTELLKKSMSKHFWGENEQKLTLQIEEKQYRIASTISSRAVQNKIEIRQIVQESGPRLVATYLKYIGEIIRERRKVENENKIKRRERIQKERLNILKQKRVNKEGQTRLAGSAIAPDMAERRLQALQKIRELNAQRKAQRGDLNMF